MGVATRTIRHAAVAGQFYPDDPAKLHKLVESYMADAHIAAAPEQVDALVAPHAGYIYSGPTAGYAYARVRGKRPVRVILLGCSHRHAFDTSSVFTEGIFETPIGGFPVDEDFAVTVAEALDSVGPEPHLREHGLEVHLPFIAEAIGFVPIVPVLFGSPVSSWHAEAGRRLAALAGPGDLLVTSTDLSHYLTNEQANEIDLRSVRSVLAGDWRSFAGGIDEGTCAMCGAAAVVAAMNYALERGAETWQLLDYRTSANASGDYSRVVGYAALSMERAA
ncbi:MAG: hypothetical protein AMXMBFR84_40110 [Candidatus Hydrogenedentota bacterium]